MVNTLHVLKASPILNYSLGRLIRKPSYLM